MRECEGLKGEGEIGSREGGHPLKRQRVIERGEPHRREKGVMERRTSKLRDGIDQ